jgi:sarcosine oxidase
VTAHDVIVIGLGGVGSAAAMHLAGRGLRVLGLDRFTPPHDLGSSHGHTRIIRRTYFEHADYVPLIERAYALWSELEAEVGERLLHAIGLVQVGPADGEVVAGVLASAAQHRLAVERLSAAELRARYPSLAPGPDDVAVLEPGAGYLLVERCVAAHLEVARRRGVRLELGRTVTGWRPDGDGVVVATDGGEHRAGALAICGGPWASSLVADLGLPLEVRRKPLFWFAAGPALHADHGFPCWLFETADGTYYGTPALDARGLKAGEHTGGEPVLDPLAIDRGRREGDEARVRRFLAGHLPGAAGPVTDHAVCMYTMTPDGHFVVDRHPAYPRVALVAGLSGHGFKMVSALGEAVSDLLVDGRTRVPTGLLALGRAALYAAPR